MKDSVEKVIVVLLIMAFMLVGSGGAISQMLILKIRPIGASESLALSNYIHPIYGALIVLAGIISVWAITLQNELCWIKKELMELKALSASGVQAQAEPPAEQQKAVQTEAPAEQPKAAQAEPPAEQQKSVQAEPSAEQHKDVQAEPSAEQQKTVQKEAPEEVQEI